MLQSIAVSMPNLLIVDDDEQILDRFRYAFPPDQRTLQIATNAREAFSLFLEVPFDVVIADICLLDSSGMQLLQRLRAIDSRIPVILMTGYGTANVAIEAMHTGAFEHLLKPFEESVLIVLFA